MNTNEPQGVEIQKFHVGANAKLGSATESIMNWRPVGIRAPWKEALPPSTDTRKWIDWNQGASERSRLANDPAGTHQYLTSEALELCGPGSELAYHKLHIGTGAMAEDRAFAPGEKLKHLVVSGDPKMLRGFAGEPASDTSAILAGAFSSVAEFLSWVNVGGEKDPLNRPYFAHFYDPSLNDGNNGLSMFNGQLRFQSALSRMKQYWKLADWFMSQNDLSNAYCALGHFVHLAQDLYNPAHVHNDIHGPTIFLGKLDTLETWMTLATHNSPLRAESAPNASMWDSTWVSAVTPDPKWVKGANIDAFINAFVLDIVLTSRRFRSVDAPGTDASQNATGELTDTECFAQAEVLVPRTISATAQLIANFQNYHGRWGK